MTAIDELRRLLDERGADYRVSATGYSIDIGPYTTAYANRSDTTLDVSLRQVTPEQAIAATLGDVPYLPYFWTHDGTLHVELPKLPESISVRLPDQRDREVGSARTWQYTLGAGTCHDKGNIERFICSECGCRLDLQDDDWEPTMWLDGAAMVPNFCPNCGRRVVDE